MEHDVEDRPEGQGPSGDADADGPVSVRVFGIGLGRAGRILAVVLAIWFAANLGWAICSTGYLEQDSVYYAEVAERIAAGEGATSLADRRGVASAREWPQPFEAWTWWPWLLAGPTSWTGLPADRVGQWLNFAAFLGLFWLLARLAAMEFVDPGRRWLAVWIAALAVSTQWGLRTTVVNEADGVSLLANLLFVGCAARAADGLRSGDGRARHGLPALVVCLAVSVVAVLLRQQNVALIVPFAWVACRAVGWTGQVRWVLMAVGVAAALVLAGGDVADGLRGLLDPGTRGSFLRSVRWLAPLGLLGLWIAWGCSQTVRIAAWLAVGHVLVLLQAPDPNFEMRWLFGIRHGLPLHLANGLWVAGAVGVLVAMPRSSRWRVAGLAFVAVTLVGAAIDNLPRPNRLARRWDERTAYPGIDLFVEYLEEHPLGDDAVVATWGGDLVSYVAGLRTVHLRGFDAAVPGHVASIHDRATHALFVFKEDVRIESVRVFQAEQEALLDALREDSEVLFAAEQGGQRVVLLKLGR